MTRHGILQRDKHLFKGIGLASANRTPRRVADSKQDNAGCDDTAHEWRAAHATEDEARDKTAHPAQISCQTKISTT